MDFATPAKAVGDRLAPNVYRPQRLMVWLAIVVGLGLTNHLTTLFLLPPAVIQWIIVNCQLSIDNWQLTIKKCFSSILDLKFLARATLAFLLPLSLYAYLPLRWVALHGEPMGFGRFVDWVVGGRFQGALQWRAWLDDPTRYAVVGRLFLADWGWLNLLLALVGLLFLVYRNWRAGLVLIATWSGYTFYALNYYVPDLNVFLMPAQVVMAVWWAAGVVAIVNGQWSIVNGQFRAATAVLLLVSVPVLLLGVERWQVVDRSQDDGLTQWGVGVLQMPLASGAAILADSEKIAPLYYLQQAEGIRPDLDIMVLPDEAAYRAELEARLAARQTVYLARFLPGLEGLYHLRSFGPLTEVSQQPLMTLPATAVPIQGDFGPVQLAGYEIEPVAAVEPTATAVTLYWQAAAPVIELDHVYVRWTGVDWSSVPVPATGQHPANNYYPTIAWRPGEIVADFHLLPHPIAGVSQRLALQVALAPPFTPPGDLAWQTVTEVILPATGNVTAGRPLRMQVGRSLLTGADFTGQIRPETPLPLLVTGYGRQPETLQFSLWDANEQLTVDNYQLSIGNYELPIVNSPSPFVYATELVTDLPNGRYYLVARDPGYGALCGWLATIGDGCVIGAVEVRGVPLPTGATNFEDKIALLGIELADTMLQPGGQLRLSLTWQSLEPMSEDYTVFVQVLDAADRLVGQVDAWPRQGTYPTSQWQPGETVVDPYVVQLSGDMPPGPYRLYAGWYLLGTLRRLAVLNEEGVPVDDKVVVPGLSVP